MNGLLMFLSMCVVVAAVLFLVPALVALTSDMPQRRHRRKGHTVELANVSRSVAFSTGFYTYRCSCGEEWTK